MGILGLAELAFAEVEDQSLTFLHRYSWKVEVVWTNRNVAESFAQRLLILPERDRSSIKIDEGTDNVADAP